jgi:hypothetical protein
MAVSVIFCYYNAIVQSKFNILKWIMPYESATV